LEKGTWKKLLAVASVMVNLQVFLSKKRIEY